MKLKYKTDCRKFRGDLPCKPHKEYDIHCDSCDYYEPMTGKILIIKFGAIGDVIRTTPLLHKLSKEMPDKEIWWITQYPDILPASKIDKILTLTPENLVLLEQVQFDIIYGLDKDAFACALTKKLNSNIKYGFTLVNGKPAPINELAEHKYNTGLFDDVNKANTKSYLEEIFEICEFKFAGEEYILDCDRTIKWDIPSQGKPVIGLNTGCGDRWVSRLWKDEYWIELANNLKSKGYFPIFLGGKQEDEKNKDYAKQTGCYYPGTFSLKEFISLMDQCDAVVSAVTMAMHLAVGLQKKLILMNNIFNKYEFELYGRGEIVQPRKECTCYFSPKCKNKEYFCMEHLLPEDVLNAIVKYV